MPTTALHPGPPIPRRAVEAVGFTLACAFTVWSAILIKEGPKAPALMALDTAFPQTIRVAAKAPVNTNNFAVDLAGDLAADLSIENTVATPRPGLDRAHDTPASHASNHPETRWFNGRPIRPARVMWMTVTAYTPGAESCWPSDDGMTATLHSVTTNAGCLVAADTSILPFGSLVSVDGYDAGSVVPVLDRGGKIRGHRLDLLMATVPEARAWGVRRIPVVIWEYADGLPATNPREVR